ncbi:unnamed protein product, partial [Rotaria sp. Silwood2]
MSNNDEAHGYEGLLITSASSNKRSLANHFVDCVKKTKYFVPCTLLSPSKTINDQTIKDTQILQLKKPIEQQPKRGSLCVAYSISNDEHTDNLILTLHVMRARQLSILDSDKMNTFVKVKQKKLRYLFFNTQIQLTYCLIWIDYKQRLSNVLMVLINYFRSDLIGCMSFNMKTLLKTTSCIKTSSKYKWYCLLPESIGRHKCMALNVNTSSSLHSKKITTLKKPYSLQNYNQSNGLVFNVDIYDRDEIHFSSGFPCKISEIKSNTSSTSTRPMPGDILLQVNDINVSRTQAKAVKKLIKSLSLPITLQLYRRSNPSTSIKIDKIVLNSVEQHEPLNRNLISTEPLYSSSDKQFKTKTYELLSEPTPDSLPSLRVEIFRSIGDI